MRAFLGSLLDGLVLWSPGWRFLDASLFRVVRHLQRRRATVQMRQLYHSFQVNPVVADGPFKGMRYATLESRCSALLPKLLGTYEREISSVVERCLKRQYEVILDIGAAEGYYAVGFAIAFPKARIVAFDTDDVACELCRANSVVNGVADRVEIWNSLDAKGLAEFPLGSRSLIICDCEGFERLLFTLDSVRNLEASDVLIEVHEVMMPGVSAYLKGVFSESHHWEGFSSVDDRDKAGRYRVPILAKVDSTVSAAALAEGRGCIMEWLFFSPRGSGEFASMVTAQGQLNTASLI